MTDDLKLPPTQGQVYAKLKGAGEVPVAELFNHVYGFVSPLGDRSMAQTLGPTITRLNRRLKAQKRAVKPGRMKYAYQLIDA